jgi:hypothetical protein
VIVVSPERRAQDGHDLRLAVRTVRLSCEDSAVPRKFSLVTEKWDAGTGRKKGLKVLLLVQLYIWMVECDEMMEDSMTPSMRHG